MTKAENITKLINTNAKLREIDHTYKINGEVYATSVTDIVDNQFPPFEKNRIAGFLTKTAKDTFK